MPDIFDELLDKDNNVFQFFNPKIYWDKFTLKAFLLAKDISISTLLDREDSINFVAALCHYTFEDASYIDDELVRTKVLPHMKIHYYFRNRFFNYQLKARFDLKFRVFHIFDLDKLCYEHHLRLVKAFNDADKCNDATYISKKYLEDGK